MGAALSTAAQGVHERLLSAGALRDACSIDEHLRAARADDGEDDVCSDGVS